MTDDQLDSPTRQQQGPVLWDHVLRAKMIPHLIGCEVRVRDLPELQHNVASLAAMRDAIFLVDGRTLRALCHVVGIDLHLSPARGLQAADAKGKLQFIYV